MNGGLEWTRSAGVPVVYPVGFDVTTSAGMGVEPGTRKLRWVVAQYYAGMDEAKIGNMKQDARY